MLLILLLLVVVVLTEAQYTKQSADVAIAFHSSVTLSDTVVNDYVTFYNSFVKDERLKMVDIQVGLVVGRADGWTKLVSRLATGKAISLDHTVTNKLKVLGLQIESGSYHVIQRVEEDLFDGRYVSGDRQHVPNLLVVVAVVGFNFSTEPAEEALLQGADVAILWQLADEKNCFFADRLGSSMSNVCDKNASVAVTSVLNALGKCPHKMIVHGCKHDKKCPCYQRIEVKLSKTPERSEHQKYCPLSVARAPCDSCSDVPIESTYSNLDIAMHLYFLLLIFIPIFWIYTFSRLRKYINQTAEEAHAAQTAQTAQAVQTKKLAGKQTAKGVGAKGVGAAKKGNLAAKKAKQAGPTAKKTPKKQPILRRLRNFLRRQPPEVVDLETGTGSEIAVDDEQEPVDIVAKSSVKQKKIATMLKRLQAKGSSVEKTTGPETGQSPEAQPEPETETGAEEAAQPDEAADQDQVADGEEVEETTEAQVPEGTGKSESKADPTKISASKGKLGLAAGMSQKKAAGADASPLPMSEYVGGNDLGEGNKQSALAKPASTKGTPSPKSVSRKAGLSAKQELSTKKKLAVPAPTAGAVTAATQGKTGKDALMKRLKAAASKIPSK